MENISEKEKKAEGRLVELNKLMLADNSLVQQKVAQFCTISGILATAFGIGIKAPPSIWLASIITCVGLIVTWLWWKSVEHTHAYRSWYADEIKKVVQSLKTE